MLTLMMLALTVLGAAAAPSPIRPDAQLTPGVSRSLTRDQVCTIKWGKDRRHVTERMKKDVFEAYGIPWEKHSLYEVDHLISRELAGADDVKNLWPQSWTGTANARMKDRLENTLHREVCAGEITLAFAQQTIRGDWIAAYRLHVPQK
jgi:hypothetical protein